MPAPRAALLACFGAGVAAVDPLAAVRAHLSREGDALRVDGPSWRDGAWTSTGDTQRWRREAGGRAIVIAAGKAAAAMAAAAEEILGDLVDGGVAVTKHGHGLPLQRIACREAGHPVPDVAGLAAAQAVADAVRGLRREDLVLCCLSGGASALLPAPPPGATLADLQELTRLLLASGAPIQDINALRRRCSRLGGGRLARLAEPAQVITLVLSDVLGDELAAIGSGPTAPDPSTMADVRTIVARSGIAAALPDALRAYLARCDAGDEPETPKPDDERFRRVGHVLVGSNRQAVAAAARQADACAARIVALADPIVGEASAAAAGFVARARALRGRDVPVALIAGGETTVTLGAAPGRGGRAQEFALAAGLALAGERGITVLAAGTDGSDGPTDAAGAFADGDLVARAAALGRDAGRHLRAHDAHPLLASTGDLLVTGPTRTNVADLYLAWIEPVAIARRDDDANATCPTTGAVNVPCHDL